MNFSIVSHFSRRFFAGTYRSQAKTMAVAISPFERNIINDSLSSWDSMEKFKKLDKESAGVLELGQLTAIFEADLQGTEKFLEQIIDHVDLERNATLNFAEFLVLMVKSQGVNGVQRAFLSYDVDASGSISRDELKDWMTRHGRFLTRRQVDMMVGAVDVNGDGEIDYHEFLNLVCRRILRMKAIAVDEK